MHDQPAIVCDRCPDTRKRRQHDRPKKHPGRVLSRGRGEIFPETKHDFHGDAKAFAMLGPYFIWGGREV